MPVICIPRILLQLIPVTIAAIVNVPATSDRNEERTNKFLQELKLIGTLGAFLMMTAIYSKRRFIKTIKMLFGVTILLYFIKILGGSRN